MVSCLDVLPRELWYEIFLYLPIPTYMDTCELMDEIGRDILMKTLTTFEYLDVRNNYRRELGQWLIDRKDIEHFVMLFDDKYIHGDMAFNMKLHRACIDYTGDRDILKMAVATFHMVGDEQMKIAMRKKDVESLKIIVEHTSKFCDRHLYPGRSALKYVLTHMHIWSGSSCTEEELTLRQWGRSKGWYLWQDIPEGTSCNII